MKDVKHKEYHSYAEQARHVIFLTYKT